VSYVDQKDKKINISIYINFFNNHTQIYPVNGLLLKKIYDNTGKFELANNVRKSRFNEKKIHTIKMKNGGEVKVTQIAGFFPRRIVSAKKENEKVMAGEYLGIIKFGSRVDLEFDGDISKILIKENQQINIGDMIYTY
jgi:phosphatidylserine decarboxylase